MKKNVLKSLILATTLVFLTACGGSANLVVSSSVTDDSNGTDGATVTNVSWDVEFESNIDVAEGFFQLYKSAEDGLYYIVSRSRAGQSLQKAYYVLNDGSKRLISDLSSFAEEIGIKKIYVEMSPGVPVEGILINSTSYNGYYLGNNYNLQIKASVFPQNADNKTIKYFSSNPAVASVNNSGKVTVRKSGTALINVISLEGNYKKTLSLNIRDGISVVKDSVSISDYSESKLIGSRYDDNSVQGSTYRSVLVADELETEIIAVGVRALTDKQNISLLQKFSINSEVSRSAISIDPQNIYFSEELNDLTRFNEKTYIAVGSLIAKEGDLSKGVISKVVEVSGATTQSVLNLEKTEVFSDAFTNIIYTSVAVIDNKIYVSGYKTTTTISASNSFFGFSFSGFGERNEKITSEAFIHIYDENLNFIKLKNYGLDVSQFTRIKKNPFSNKLLISGRNERTTFIGELDSNLEGYFGFYSNTNNSTINDVIAVSENEYVAVGQGTIGDNKIVGFISIFNRTNNNIQSSNYKISEIHLNTYFNRVYFVGGILSVLGYSYNEEGGLFGFFKEPYEYSTVSNFDLDLSYITGLKYFNANTSGGKGTKQRFNDGVIIGYNTFIGVGQSNYNNKDTVNAYIQYNVPSVINNN
jgi:hypothetical protein